MSRSDGTHDATVYLQVAPTWGWAPMGTDPPVHGARVVKLTQNRPSRLEANAVAVKITLRIPDGAFYPLAPEAVVEIPADLIQRPEITVTAEDPNDPEAADA